MQADTGASTLTVASLLKRHGERAQSAIKRYVEAIHPELDEARLTLDHLMGNAVNERVRNAYWQQRIRNLESGLAELNNL